MLEEDRESGQPEGTAFVRRHQFGRYLSAMVQQHSTWSATGSAITHCHDKAIHADWDEGGWRIQLDSGDTLSANLLCLATGNPELRLPATLTDCRDALPGLIENPFAPGSLAALRPTDRVLVVGSGLTALDTLSTMIRRGHSGPIDIVSRHGMRPAPQGRNPEVLQKALQFLPLEAMSNSLLHDRVLTLVPEFLRIPADTASTGKLRRWLVALRNRIANGQAQGDSWQAGFDELRDGVWQLWPTLPLDDRRRFIRHLKP